MSYAEHGDEMAAAESAQAEAEHLTPVVTAMLADAWRQGHATGSSRAMRHMSDEPDLPLDGVNPWVES